MKNNEPPLMPKDELDLKIDRWQQQQQIQKARSIKLEAIFIRFFDRFLPFLKPKD